MMRHVALILAVACTTAEPVVMIRSFKEGLPGVMSANPEVKLRVGSDPAAGDEPVLFVEYPGPSENPAGRDIWCEAEIIDWTGGRAIAFRIKPAKALKLSVSFVDRNGVAYTSWVELEGGTWQDVHLPFSEMRPNPYFQPPGAKAGAPLDVSEVRAIGFAAQDQSPGAFRITSITLR